MKYFLPHHTIVLLSNALVIPHFNYGSAVWSNFLTEFHNKLQVLYNNLARIILSADIRTPINEMTDALEWFKLDRRWHDKFLLIVFKCLRTFSLSYLSSQFEFVHSLVMLWLYVNNSNSGLRTLHVRAAHAWNNLPSSVRTEMINMSVNQFKSKSHQI